MSRFGAFCMRISGDYSTWSVCLCVYLDTQTRRPSTVVFAALCMRMRGGLMIALEHIPPTLNEGLIIPIYKGKGKDPFALVVTEALLSPL